MSAKQHIVLCALYFGEKDTGGDVTDAQFRDLSLLLEGLRAALSERGALVVKTIGHEILGAIAEPRDVLPALLACRESLANSLVARRNAAQLKVALHHGEVILKDGDIFGDNVSLAFRLHTRSAPAPRGIFFTARAAEALPARDQLRLKKYEISHGTLKPEICELLGPPQVYEL